MQSVDTALTVVNTAVRVHQPTSSINHCNACLVVLLYVINNKVKVIKRHFSPNLNIQLTSEGQLTILLNDAITRWEKYYSNADLVYLIIVIT